MNYRTIKLSSGIEIFLGKDAKGNDELVKSFKGKENTILHTISPGSPFCVINSEKYSNKDLKEASIICASKSQDWRDNQSDVSIHKFTGKDVKKPFFAKAGTWRVISKPEVIKVKKSEIKSWLSKKSN